MSHAAKARKKTTVTPALLASARKNGLLGGKPKSYPQDLSYDDLARWRFARLYKVVESGCWEWQGSCCPQTRYGNFHFRGRCNTAHRTQWILTFGEIPKGLSVCHKCDNRKCVNPEHFFLGTQKDNIRDAMRKGRHVSPPVSAGESNYLAKLTAQDIPRIREMGRNGESLVKIGRMFGVDPVTIKAVVIGKTWKHVPA